MTINEEVAEKIIRARKNKPGEFHKKLVKSHYGSWDEIIKRAEFMFSEYLSEMDRYPDNGDPLAAGYVFHLIMNRDHAELINYILTGEPIPQRGRGAT